tara:strand:- start:5278 stop:5856 length:579 start_codon:yes stop_codon:yes gene_type:complete
MDFAGQPQPSDQAAAIGMIWDRLAVTDILHRYCHALDRRDFGLMESCFHADATMDYASQAMTSDAFIGFARHMAGMLRWTVHQLSNFTISIEGDIARTESYVFAYHRIPAEAEGDYYFRLNGQEQIALVTCRYIDRFEKRDGLWRIAHRVIPVFDNVEYRAPDNGGFFESDEYARKAHGADDPGYALTEGWR